jgi:integrase
MREIGPEEVQRFVSSVKLKGKTVKNLFARMQTLWKSARVWGYVAHDAVSDVRLPKRQRVTRSFFSVDEVQRILAAAPEPYHTFIGSTRKRAYVRANCVGFARVTLISNAVC